MIFLNSCSISEGLGIGRKLKAPHRISGNKESIINPESIYIERTASGDAISLTFETKFAADCQFGFYVNDSSDKSPSSYVPCSGKSALKFAELVNGLPKDKLVSIVVRAWKSGLSMNSAQPITISEDAPTADNESLNLLLVDLGGHRLEVTSIANKSKPSALISSSLTEAIGCGLSDSKTIGISDPRRALLLQSASSRGFVNSTVTRISPSILAGTFLSPQRESGEWNVSAKSSDGFGQLRVAKPSLLTTVTFSGVNQSLGLNDELEDIDPPAIKVQNSLEVSWSIQGDAAKSSVIYTIAPGPNFPGITCKDLASKGKITLPADLLAKIPVGQRLWSTLRLDSFQGLENERWVVRVSDWNSMGIQRM